MKLADVQFSDHERVVVAQLTGEIDLSNADGIEAAIAEATPNHALGADPRRQRPRLPGQRRHPPHLQAAREAAGARPDACGSSSPPTRRPTTPCGWPACSRNVDTVETLDAAMAAFSTESRTAEAEVPDPGNV